MPDGGWVVKFDGKVVKRCHLVSFDYDRWEVTFNYSEKAALPENLKTISVENEVLPDGER